jgi:4-hydroxybenzoate polyprenyltransferase
MNERSTSPVVTTSSAAPVGSIWDYVSIARPDHWFKNVFMLVGIVLGYFYFVYQPGGAPTIDLVTVGAAFLATCLIASSNYVINEILDAPTDLSHPTKQNRPIPSGRVRLPLAYAEWLLLAVAGLGLALWVNVPFFATGLLLWIMGLVYNVPPVRSKDWPYVDVVSESVNNPLRLALGWFVVTGATTGAPIPPMSLLISYWMIGAFFMATKRFAEYRSINDPVAAAAYRNSFRYYDSWRLLNSMFFYATSAALFLGVFIIRYRLELILSVPLIAGFFSYYMRIALKDDSPVQAPERLYRERGLMAYLVLCVAVFVGLMFVHIPMLYEWFNVPTPDSAPSLWSF